MAATRTAIRFAPRAIAPRPRLLHAHQSSRPLFSHQTASRRTFLTDLLPRAPHQTVAARLPVPYPALALYDLIVDVDSYTTFLPFCHHSHVTRWTSPDASGRRWPTQADLTAGFGSFEETYTSRLFCHPGRLVIEAISGDATTELSLEELRELGLRDVGHEAAVDFNAKHGSARWQGGESVFKSLYTKWTVRPLEPKDPARTDFGHAGKKKVDYTPRKGDWSDVRLSIRFQFENPLYAAVSGAMQDQIAKTMIEAFEKRAREVL